MAGREGFGRALSGVGSDGGGGGGIGVVDVWMGREPAGWAEGVGGGPVGRVVVDAGVIYY